jgi:hypothetical protein
MGLANCLEILSVENVIVAIKKKANGMKIPLTVDIRESIAPTFVIAFGIVPRTEYTMPGLVRNLTPHPLARSPPVLSRPHRHLLYFALTLPSSASAPLRAC